MAPTFIWRISTSMPPRSWSVMAILSWARAPAISSRAVLAHLDEVVQQLYLLAFQPAIPPG